MNSGHHSESTLLIQLLELSVICRKRGGAGRAAERPGVLVGPRSWGALRILLRNLDSETIRDLAPSPSGAKVIGKCPNAYPPGMARMEISLLRMTQSVGLASKSTRKFPCFSWPHLLVAPGSSRSLGLATAATPSVSTLS